MFVQFLATTTTVYGELAALKSLLQARQMLARRTSSGISAEHKDPPSQARDVRSEMDGVTEEHLDRAVTSDVRRRPLLWPECGAAVRYG